MTLFSKPSSSLPLLVLILAFFVASSSSSSLHFASAAKAKSEQASFSTPPYNPYEAMSQLYYSKAAVCDPSKISSWSCGLACDYHPDFQVKSVIYNTSGSNEQLAYTGYSPSERAIILTFRGTETLSGWKWDAHVEKDTFRDPRCLAAIGENGCQVEDGFLSVWLEFSATVLSDVQTLLALHEVKTIKINGHSLGAAVGVICAIEVTRILEKMSSPAQMQIYTYGEPRVGVPSFVKWAYNGPLRGVPNYRLVNKRDPVPHLPPMDFGYLHIPREVWYKHGGNTSWKVCDGTDEAEDPNCSDSELPIDPFDHLNYLGVYTGCAKEMSKEEKEKMEIFKNSKKFKEMTRKIIRDKKRF